jgi:hypothetical protein
VSECFRGDKWHLSCICEAESGTSVDDQLLCNPYEMTDRAYTAGTSPGADIMRSLKHQQSFREDRASKPSGEVTPSPDVGAKPSERAAAPMNVSMWAPQPWIQAAEAVADWYGAMFRLAFGLERVNSRSSVTVPSAPTNEQPESPRVAPLHSMPAAPVQLRARRRKSPTSRSRSSKTSGVRRSRRAA